ncbi:hypothetical protein L207DRAFT_520149 [Hyaloscypha variabilis F]|uniref:Uncharacterized protein n=1 Tax=Hyaloscypha variabilis (strain UAMH 11265 / GT02V1 / F) TaxID=1149755 RepID=A0A2J6QWL6_HYAVF|nr:hypothetical protein L207DRAFT_520149 [Hyaloscypha variabilis F]
MPTPIRLAMPIADGRIAVHTSPNHISHWEVNNDFTLASYRGFGISLCGRDKQSISGWKLSVREQTDFFAVSLVLICIYLLDGSWVISPPQCSMVCVTGP